LTSILYDKKRFRVLQTETLALPEKSTEVYLDVSQLKITLRFQDRSNDDLNVVVSFDQNTGMLFEISGFHNSLGSSFDTSLGDIAGKQLKMSAMSYGIGEKAQPPRLLTLTFFVEE